MISGLIVRSLGGFNISALITHGLASLDVGESIGRRTMRRLLLLLSD